MQDLVNRIDWQDPLTYGAIGGAVFLILLLMLIVLALRASQRAGRAAEPLAHQVNALSQGQQQLVGGLEMVAKAQVEAQTNLLKTVEQRLEQVSARMGESLSTSATRTAHSLGELQQRLAAIDKAQTNIEKLSGDVLSLQDILSNKQARGAFGEIQLNDIVTKALPPDAYSFQTTLSNGKRADCLIRLPNPPGAIVIDAKFPLEPYEALRRAETEADKREAARLFRNAVQYHVKAIAERYIVEGETADSALMFLPSEAVYAELHANFPQVVHESFAHRVWIVSPTTMMATLNTMRAILKDARMREQAGAIRRELNLLTTDIARLLDRVDNLDRHFDQAHEDIRKIKISAEKAGNRAERLEVFEFEEGTVAEAITGPETVPERAS
ncbi:MAG: DNA recombination protein RmuC [Paracoccaceae bacterium]|nr:DNA recombination protein RmuC [Paracoccaceae bacterium]